MRIVILDGFTTTAGDLDWSPLEGLGSLTVYDRTAPEAVEARSREADAILINKTQLGADVLSRLPRLRYIGILATGWNTLDLAAAHAQGITVCNAAGYGTDSVAQHTFALLLELSSRVCVHARSVQTGAWSASPDWTYLQAPLMELSGKTLGLIGPGRIGGRVAEIARAFGMQVQESGRSGGLPPGQLFETSDVVSLHCPLTPQTHEMVHAGLLRRMKPGAFLINTSRGALIREADLAQALREGWLAGAALDVLAQEPPPPDHPLLHAPNCLITPHIAWATPESRSRLIRIAAENLRAFAAGSPRNLVIPS
jgi:glycerate dehydrogenase